MHRYLSHLNLLIIWCVCTFPLSKKQYIGLSLALRRPRGLCPRYPVGECPQWQRKTFGFSSAVLPKVKWHTLFVYLRISWSPDCAAPFYFPLSQGASEFKPLFTPKMRFVVYSRRNQDNENKTKERERERERERAGQIGARWFVEYFLFVWFEKKVFRNGLKCYFVFSQMCVEIKRDV